MFHYIWFSVKDEGAFKILLKTICTSISITISIWRLTIGTNKTCSASSYKIDRIFVHLLNFFLLLFLVIITASASIIFGELNSVHCSASVGHLVFSITISSSSFWIYDLDWERKWWVTRFHFNYGTVCEWGWGRNILFNDSSHYITDTHPNKRTFKHSNEHLNCFIYSTNYSLFVHDNCIFFWIN
jgi:hypothetical protein